MPERCAGVIRARPLAEPACEYKSFYKETTAQSDPGILSAAEKLKERSRV